MVILFFILTIGKQGMIQHKSAYQVGRVMGVHEDYMGYYFA